MLTAIAALAGLLTVTSITADPIDGITLTFNQPVDAASFTGETVTLIDMSGGRALPIHAWHSVTENDMRLVFSEPLTDEAVVRVVLHGGAHGIRASRGEFLRADVLRDFTVGTAGRDGNRPSATVGYIDPLTRVSISAQEESTCVTDTHQNVWCFGHQGPGLGFVANDHVPTPTKVPNFTGVTGRFPLNNGAGEQRCIVASPGFGATGWYCWGQNGFGEIGTGGANPMDVFHPTAIKNTDGGTDVAHSAHSSCMRYKDWSISCTGWNHDGELANGLVGGSQTAFMPIVKKGPWVSVSNGGLSMCAIDNALQPWCWGNNALGELGDGTKFGTNVPIAVKNVPQVWQVAGNLDHTCALLVGGGVDCWGVNDSGQIGDGTNAPERLQPTPVKGLDKVVSIAAGEYFSCALKYDGTVWCWGTNGRGELGNANAGISSSVPVQVPIPVIATPDSKLAPQSYVMTIGVGGSHACAFRSDGTLWCWGANWYGQLGIGIKGNVNVPPTKAVFVP